ncbi:MAG: preprotein translocase subunit YajC [Ruminococcaceae bacterium]|nr:preprotein translocase subunit YajC [Oscillospiraceae bacterium]
MSILRVFAEGAQNVNGGEPPAPGIMEMIISFLPMILLVAVFYFILIRPQRKKDKETKQMLANLIVGDKITTIGGIVGTIIKIKDEKIMIETGSKTEKTVMTLERWAVRDVEKKETAD